MKLESLLAELCDTTWLQIKKKKKHFSVRCLIFLKLRKVDIVVVDDPYSGKV